MEVVKLIDGKRYRLVSNKKQKGEAGQYFLDQESGNLIKCVARTAEKFYVYEYEGEGRYYISQRQRNKSKSENDDFAYRHIIFDAKEKRIVGIILNKQLVEKVLHKLNERILDNYE